MDLQLKNRIGLITGAGQGIGKAIALRLAQEGCHVGICDLQNVDHTIEEILSYGVRAHSAKADVTDPEQVERFIGIGEFCGMG